MRFHTIIPTLNEAEKLPILLQFLSDEGIDPRHISVVDANSPDQTAQIARKFGVNVLLSAKGRSKQMNLGALSQEADYLYFLHADTLPPKGFLNELNQAIDERFEAACFCFEFDKKHPRLAFNAQFTRKNFLYFRGGDQSLMIHKGLFDALGGFREDFPIMEEYDLIRRLRKKARFKVIQKPIVVSARKYEQNSYFRVNVANVIAVLLFAIGVHPKHIKAFYFKAIRHPKA